MHILAKVWSKPLALAMGFLTLPSTVADGAFKNSIPLLAKYSELLEQ
jgi:hypothetical protein